MPVVKAPTVVQTGHQRRRSIPFGSDLFFATLSFEASIELFCALCTVVSRGQLFFSCLRVVLGGLASPGVQPELVEQAPDAQGVVLRRVRWFQ